MHDAFFLRSAHSANAMWVDPPLRTSGTVPRRKPWLWSSIQFEFFLLVLSRGSLAGYMTSLCCGFFIRRLNSHKPLQSTAGKSEGGPSSWCWHGLTTSLSLCPPTPHPCPAYAAHAKGKSNHLARECPRIHSSFHPAGALREGEGHLGERMLTGPANLKSPHHL